MITITDSTSAVDVFEYYFNIIDQAPSVRPYASDAIKMLHNSNPPGDRLVEAAITEDGVKFIVLYTKIGNVIFYLLYDRANDRTTVRAESPFVWRQIVPPYAQLSPTQLALILEDSRDGYENYFTQLIENILEELEGK